LDQTLLSSSEKKTCIDALQKPEPRVALGLALRDIAHSAIDISDGLIADLGHILAQSHLGADVYWNKVPHVKVNSLDESMLKSLSLAGGDDYEICFTAPSSQHTEILRIGEQLKVNLSCIGVTKQECLSIFLMRIINGLN
jgi:thiamine-monophosphate kinase